MGIEFHFDLHFDELDSKAKGALPTALGRAAEHVIGVATPKIPVETGQLVGSADVRIENGEASITYPGPYARYQHYNISRYTGAELKHDGPKSKNPNAEGLWLERPMASEAHKVIDIIGTDIGRAI